MDDGGRFDMAPAGMGFGGNMRNPAGKIRKFFPETWIWDLIPVGYVSCTMGGGESFFWNYLPIRSVYTAQSF